MSNTVSCQALFLTSPQAARFAPIFPEKNIFSRPAEFPQKPQVAPDLLDFPAKISLPGIDDKAIGIAGIDAYRDRNAFAVDE